MKKILFQLIIVQLLLCFFSFSLKSEVLHGRITIDNAGKLYSTSGQWKFHFGDNLKWADPDFNDSDWEYIHFPSWVTPPSGKKLPGLFWYRLKFSLGKDVIKKIPLLISIPRIFHAYEVFCNGEKLGGRGILPDTKGLWKWGVGGIHVLVNKDDLYSDRDNILAIRVYGGYRYFAGSLCHYSYISTYNLRNNSFLFMSILNYILGLLFIIIGIFHLSLFRKLADKASLCFVIINTAIGIACILYWLPDTLSRYDTQFLHLLTTLFILIADLGFLYFLYYFFEDVFKRLKKLFFTIALIMLSAAVIVFITRYFPLAHVITISIFFWIIFFIPFIAFISVKEILKNHREAWLVLSGALIGATFEIIDIMQHTGLTDIPLPNFLWIVSPIGFLIFSITLSFSLRKKYVRIYSIGKKPGQNKKNRLQPEKYSYLKGINTDMIQQKINELMEKEKLFYDEELNIYQLASQLSLSHYQLSQFLNESLKMNFNTFVNKYRINEAKKLLAEDRESSILSIAFRVGFNSSSRFYAEFKKFTGETPTEFKKKASAH